MRTRILCLLLLSLDASACLEERIEYTPLVRVGANYKEMPELKNELHLSVAKEMLRECGGQSPPVLHKGKLFIPKSAAEDKKCIAYVVVKIEQEVLRLRGEEKKFKENLRQSLQKNTETVKHKLKVKIPKIN
jgi:hypothetical protein